MSAICAGATAIWAGEVSTIVLPIEFRLDGFVADAEREVPKRLKSDWEAVGKTVKMPVAYRFELDRSPIEIEGQADRVLISTKIRYRVDVGVPGPSSATVVGWRRVNGCQPRKLVTVSLYTRIEFTPDWQLRTRSQPKLDMPEPCRLSAARELVNVDISEKVRGAFLDGLYKAARDFDRRLAAQVLLRELAQRAWSSLAEPVPFGETAWLKLNPSRVLVMRPEASGQVVKTGVVVEGVPQLLAELGPATAARPLPALELTGPQEGFRLNWTSALAWPEVVEQMRRTWVGEQIKVSGRRTVRVEDVHIEPQGERVLLTADLTGGVKGRIQLTGQPRFDVASHMLEFAELDFTLDTKSFLVRVADWFRHEATRRKLAALARVDVNASLEKARAQLEQGLRQRFGDGLVLGGTLAIAEPSTLEFDASSVRWSARLTGTLTLRWDVR